MCQSINTASVVGCVTLFVLAIYILKNCLIAKEELWETQIFHHAKKYQSSNNPLKETKILQDIL